MRMVCRHRYKCNGASASHSELIEAGFSKTGKPAFLPDKIDRVIASLRTRQYSARFSGVQLGALLWAIAFGHLAAGAQKQTAPAAFYSAEQAARGKAVY